MGEKTWTSLLSEVHGSQALTLSVFQFEPDVKLILDDGFVRIGKCEFEFVCACVKDRHSYAVSDRSGVPDSLFGLFSDVGTKFCSNPRLLLAMQGGSNVSPRLSATVRHFCKDSPCPPVQ